MTRARPTLSLVFALLSLIGGSGVHAWMHAEAFASLGDEHATPSGHAEIHDGGCPHLPDDHHAHAPDCTQCKLAHSVKALAATRAVALAEPTAATRLTSRGPIAAAPALPPGVLGARGPPAITG